MVNKNIDATMNPNRRIITTSSILEKKKDNIFKRILNSSADVIRMLWRSLILAMNFYLVKISFDEIQTPSVSHFHKFNPNQQANAVSRLTG